MAVDPQDIVEKAAQRPQSVTSDGTTVTQRSASDLITLADRAAAGSLADEGVLPIGVVPVIHRRRP